MKILQVIDKLDIGGTERVAIDLAILLAKNKKIEVSFLCLLSLSILDKELLENGISIKYLNRKNKYNPITLLRMLSVFNNYDIVHIHSRQVLRYVGLLNFIPNKKKYKIIFQDHYGKISTDKFISSYTKKAIKNTDAYIGVSSELTNWAIENHLNKNIFQLSNISRKQNQFKKLNFPSKIITIGNFRPQKNYEFLCELISILPSEITIDIYGNKTDETYFKKIKQLIYSLKLENRIKCFHNKTNISKYIKNYSLALHCASSETGPLVAIEYLLQEIPVIMYQTGEVANVLLKNNYPLLLNSFDKNLWKEKITSYFSDLQQQEILKNKTKEIVKKNFSEEEYVKKCIQIYQTLL